MPTTTLRDFLADTGWGVGLDADGVEVWVGDPVWDRIDPGTPITALWDWPIPATHWVALFSHPLGGLANNPAVLARFQHLTGAPPGRSLEQMVSDFDTSRTNALYAQGMPWDRAAAQASTETAAALWEAYYASPESGHAI